MQHVACVTHHDDVGVVVLGPDVEVDWAAPAVGLPVDDSLGQLVVAGSPPRGRGHHVEGAAKNTT